jgi:uncharacterized protein (DUF58 family)
MVRPTRRGVSVLVAGCIALVVGWLFGLPEATALGAASIAVLVTSTAALLLAGHPPAVQRIVRPPRLRVGDPCNVILAVRNVAARRSPVTTLCDQVGDGGRAEMLIGPLATGGTTGATYSIPSTRRGVHRLGPLRSTVEDPFGLVLRTATSASLATVLIVPRSEALTPLPPAVGDEPELGTHSMVASSTVDEEFTGLRPYTPGDDVRRIHWPSTARTGAAVVRQFEVPWQHRTTVLLDLRATSHQGESFERMVTVAASLVRLAATRGELLRFATTQDPDPPFSDARADQDALLDRLAVIGPRPGGDARNTSLVAAVELLTRTATGRLVVCTGALPGAEADAVRTAVCRAGLAIVTTTGVTPPDAITDRALTGIIEVHWNGTEPLAECWRAATAPALGGGVR